MCLVSEEFRGKIGNTSHSASPKLDGCLSDVIQAVRPLFPASDVAEAVTFLRKSGRKIDTDSLIDAVYAIRERRPEETKQRQQQQTRVTADKSACDPEILDSVEVGDNCSASDDEDGSCSAEDESPLESRAARIERAKLFYKQRIQALEVTCQSCRRRKADVLLLPCAHLACCKYCLKDIRRCPVPRCKKVVRGTKEVFFVG